MVICTLGNGETMITEKGSMSWMSPNMQMETHGGGLGRMFSKALSGESMFQNHYTARGGNGLIAFCSSFPGQIKPLQIAPGREMTVGLDGRRVIKKGDTYIATVEFKGTQGPGYEMDILNPKNAELVLAAVVAMHIIEDKASQRQRHHHHHHH